MNEPLKTEKPDGQGRPAYTNEQYEAWLTEMKPYLEMGNSLHYAAKMAAISPHYVSILKKYKINDWFSLKIDAYRAMPGELVNNAFVRLAQKAADKVKTESKLDDNEFKALKFMAEKHRTSQPFFVNRTETAEAKEKDLGKIIERMDTSDYDDVAKQAEKQILEANPPVQNQEQGGSTGDVQTEHNAAQSHGEEGQPSVQSDPQA